MLLEAGGELRFRFDERRAVQAAAVLLREAGGTENYTSILKELYLADRQSLIETGQPITGSTFVSMANGPVLSEVYNCIKGEVEVADSLWDHCIRTQGYNVELVEDPGDDQLSDYDVGVLTDLAKKYKRVSYTHLIDVVHGLPEWKHPKPAKVAPLPAADILRAVGENDEAISDRAKRAKYLAAVDRLIHSS
jgi:uncharacterized phage-associated protein